MSSYEFYIALVGLIGSFALVALVYWSIIRFK